MEDKTENLSDPTGLGAKIKIAGYFILGFLLLLLLIPILKIIL